MIIPDKIRNLFEPKALTYLTIETYDRDLCAIFSVTGGDPEKNEHQVALRREYLLDVSASNKKLSPVSKLLGKGIISVFSRELEKSKAQILHAEKLQEGLVRLTFHPLNGKIDRQARGYVLLTSELGEILDSSIETMMRNHEANIPMQFAVRHNVAILGALSRGETPDLRDADIFVSKKFEGSPPKLQNS